MRPGHTTKNDRTEHIEQAQKRDAKIKASAAIPQSNDSVAEPLKIPGITYHEVNFNGSAFSRMLISKLTWIETLKLVGLMIFGYRLDAIKVLAPTMNGMGLVGLAISSLDVCTKEVKQVFDFLGDESNWPTLVHCTQGKDRTGLIVQLLLFLLHVDVSAIDEDYMLSGPELEAERKERVEEISKIGLGEEFAVCSPGVVTKVHAHIKEKYGSVEEYLEGAGVEAETVERIKRILKAEE
jgi:protein-tyrosine phosphatase